MALPKFIGTTKDAKVAAMDQDLDVLEKAVQLYESDNDGGYPFIKDGSGNYAKVSITRQTLKDTLDAIGDDESSVYTLDMTSLKPYLERLKFTDPTTDTYLYSTKTGVVINEQGKIDSSGITHHILNGLSSTSMTTTKKAKFNLMLNSHNSYTSFIIGESSTLYAIGYNAGGQLGIGTADYNSHSAPTEITFPNGVKPTQITGSQYHSVAIGNDGELYTWGNNSCGQLGYGTTANNYAPTKITLASGVKPKQIACGYDYTMAIGSDGELYTWGRNYYGELGDGTIDYGQLGDGTTEHKSTPTKIILASGVKPIKIAAGLCTSMAIGDDGNLYSWGDNCSGQLGNGSWDGDSHSTPTKITFPNGVKPTNIVCGQNHSMAIGSDGELYTWGSNTSGQLGNGTPDEKDSPTKISLVEGVKPTQIACGQYFSMAIGSDKKLYTWGENSNYELGNGKNGWSENKNLPLQITLASGVKGSDGELYTWGQNTYGQLGDGTSNNSNTPIKVDFNFE